ncbi:MAG: bifunctional adenosylcobinamide kinase/adenosylcobinamide-phosphate guanylyltransferase [Bacillota bacterium]|jgi:adenosylcobinamide kinase/adenosylcobinamide-phosphate guanylyltransferase
MKLIIGGAYQGKSSFVRRNFNTEPKICNETTALTASAVNCFHLLIKDLLQTGKNPQDFTKKLINDNPQAIIICDEVGLGIVPLDSFERRWREEVGRCLCLIAEKADYVSRLTAGLEIRIK